MALLFRADDAAHDTATNQMFAAQSVKGMSRAALIFLLVWVALLLVGTLKLDIFTGSYLYVNLPLAGAQEFQALLDRLVPFDASKGEEGVSVQGVHADLCWLPSGWLHGAASSAFTMVSARGHGPR